MSLQSKPRHPQVQPELTTLRLAVYSIWLCPKPSQTPALQETIDRLAKQYQPAPTFAPHVTFYSGIDTSVPVEKVKATLKTGLQRWSKECELKAPEGESDAVLDLGLDLPTAGTFFFQAIIQPITEDITIPAEPSVVDVDTTLSADSPKRTGFEALLRGRQILEQVFEAKPAKPYFPHLSLMYSDKDHQALQAIVNEEFSVPDSEEKEAGKLSVAETVGFSRVTVVACVGKTEEWKEVARFDLEGNEIEQ